MGLQLSGSVQLEGNLLVTGSANSVFENVLVTGTLVAQEIETQLVSSSIIYSSGSNKFGDLVTNTQQFTGSLQVSGSSHSILGNVGVGVAPVEYSFPDNNNIQVRRAILAGTDNSMRLSINTNYSANDFRRISTGRASMYQQSDGNHYFFTSPTGNSGTNPNFTSSLTLDAAGAATFDNTVNANGISSIGREQAFTWQRTTGTASDVYSLNADSATAYLYNNTTANALMTWSESGSVGIGTVTPAGILTAAQSNADSLTNVTIDNIAAFPASAGTQGTIFRFRSRIDDTAIRTTGAIASYAMKSTGAGANNNGDLRFYTGNEGDVTEAMRITGRRLGINYNNSAIHTYGSGAYSAQLTVKTTSASALTLLNSTTGGDAQVAINFVNEFVSDQYNYIARIIAEPEGSWNSTASTRDSRLSFHTTLNGVTSEVVRINSAGSMIVGASYMTYPLSVEAQSGGGQLALTRSGAVGEFYMGGTTGGTTELYVRSGGSGGVRLDAGATGWVSASDIRLKNIERTIDNAVESLKGLQTIYYSWKNAQNSKQHIGLIAQEVEECFPEIVSESSMDGMKGINYTELIPVLIKAIQEQQVQIEELKSRIETLENI